MTSCEALWMGVPVITWPQSTMVSRQTFALLSAIGMTELVANNADQYVQIASDLANDVVQLERLRHDLRPQMQAADLMNLSRFVDQLEQALLAVGQQT
jgi:predicted O-linked N-acetylglucosamine transferase (SPINDLY family)